MQDEQKPVKREKKASYGGHQKTMGAVAIKKDNTKTPRVVQLLQKKASQF